MRHANETRGGPPRMVAKTCWICNCTIYGYDVFQDESSELIIDYDNRYGRHGFDECPGDLQETVGMYAPIPVTEWEANQ